MAVEVEEAAQLHETIILRRFRLLAPFSERGVRDTGHVRLTIDERAMRASTVAPSAIVLLVNSPNFLWVSSIA